MIKKSAGRRTFEVINVIILLIISFLMLYPFYYCIIASLSNSAAVLAGKLSFWPIGLNFKSYKLVLGYKVVLTSYGNTLLYTTVGTLISLVLTVLGAYPLSRKDFYGKGLFTVFFAFTMFFGGGLIPTFLVVRSLGFYNTMWAIVLPSAVSTMNMIIMRTFFQGIPDALEEAAVVDGASELTTLLRIILPLSLPSMMTIGLFYAVGLWNSWFSAVIYLADTDKYPIQLVLRQIVLQNQVNEIIGTVAGSATEDTTQMIAENVKYTVIIVAVVPILCVYPFIQKYFVKGVMIGSIKG